MFSMCCNVTHHQDDGIVLNFSTTDEVPALSPRGQPPAQPASAADGELSPPQRELPAAEAEAPGSRRLLGHPLNLAPRPESPGAGKAAKLELESLSARTPLPPPDSPRSGGSQGGAWVPEEEAEAAEEPGIEEERARLQELVTGFVRKSVRGYPCTLLAEGPGAARRVAARFFVDSELRGFSVAPVRAEAAWAEVSCPIGGIRDILHTEKDGFACFEPEVAAALRPGEDGLLLALTLQDGPDTRSRVHLLMDSRRAMDTFLECMQVLCLYVQSLPARPTG